jgi:hypothetical protein
VAWVSKQRAGGCRNRAGRGSRGAAAFERNPGIIIYLRASAPPKTPPASVKTAAQILCDRSNWRARPNQHRNFTWPPRCRWWVALRLPSRCAASPIPSAFLPITSFKSAFFSELSSSPRLKSVFPLQRHALLIIFHAHMSPNRSVPLNRNL